MFQHTAARRRLGPQTTPPPRPKPFQHTAARRRLGSKSASVLSISPVSTHSRPKAAGRSVNALGMAVVIVSTHSRPKAAGFFSCFSLISIMFQHTAARRRLVYIAYYIPTLIRVSTHSRPKAAGFAHDGFKRAIQVSTHSRPKAAGSVSASSPKMPCSFNTQPPEGGWDFFSHFSLISIMFQHTAARRRLEGGINSLSLIDTVSTHSRPKAAGRWYKFP